MNGTATLLLLFVAAGLLVLLGVGIGRSRGRQPSRRDSALMAGMTGAACAFLTTFMGAGPLVFPTGATCVLVAIWLIRGQWAQLGAFLIGAGLLVASMQTYQLVNDLLDPAVTVPGWTPAPLAIGVAAVILGTSLFLAAPQRAEAAT
jgi:hypothetical protein